MTDLVDTNDAEDVEVLKEENEKLKRLWGEAILEREYTT